MMGSVTTQMMEKASTSETLVPIQQSIWPNT
jgi:hypothetical protein